MKVLIEPQTAESVQLISIGASRKMTISSGKLAGAEVVTFQLDEDGVSPLGDLYQDGSIRQLTATNNAVIVDGPIDLRVTKGVTALEVGVYLKG